ncbi:MAG: DUF4185 domain-containing protein [Candidatus Omnitrophica bacterium]|nr:DUF4185 domain-containing protein [Candidatus Omnitrophota bacterium]
MTFSAIDDKPLKPGSPATHLPGRLEPISSRTRQVSCRATRFLFLAVLLTTNFVQANIWIDEGFESTTAFGPATLDTFDRFPPPEPPITISLAEGTIDTSRSYEGDQSYRLSAGEAVLIEAGQYDNPTNGPFQYLQFATSVGSIPPSGDLAELRWNWTINSTDYSFFLKWISDGSSVDLIAGEDSVIGVTETIGTISDTTPWMYITLQFQKNGTSETDSRTGQTLTQGMRIYVDSNVPALEIELPGVGAASDRGGELSWTVTQGQLFIDDLYWEGGMTNGDESSSNLRPFEGMGEMPLCGSFPEETGLELISSEVHPLYEFMLTPQPVGWLGADAAHSIPLSATQNLWLFSDTLLGTVTNGSRDGGGAFINSSIGIQDLTQPPPGNVEFYWGPNETSFFPHQPGTGGDYYWPFNGFLYQSELFIYCFNVTSGGGGFSTVGATLIRIPNPYDPPGEWVQNAVDLGIGDDHQGFHTAVFLDEPYVYLMGFDDTGGRRMVLARTLVADVVAGATSDAYEFWTEGPSGPEWTEDKNDLVTLFRPGVTEAGIQYEPTFDLYFCTTYDVFGPNVYLSTAPELTGPWSEPTCVYQVPEHQIEIEGDVISYAVRPHPELSNQPGEIVLTYATNLFGAFFPLFTEAGYDIYWPRFIRIQVEGPPSAVSAWRLY